MRIFTRILGVGACVGLTLCMSGSSQPGMSTESLRAVADSLAEADANYSEALRVEKLIAENQRNTIGESNIDYAQTLQNIARYHFIMGNNYEALRNQKWAVDILATQLDHANEHYLEAISDLAIIYEANGSFQEAIRYGLEAVNTRRNIPRLDNNFFNSALQLAKAYNQNGQYNEAIVLTEEVIDILRSNGEDDTPVYAEAKNYLSSFHHHAGNYDKAVEIARQASESALRQYGECSVQYAETLSLLASFLNDVGDFGEGIRCGMKAVAIFEKEDTPTEEYALALNNLAALYHQTGNYSEAARYGVKAAEIYHDISSEDDPNYATLLCNIAVNCSQANDLVEAIRLGEEAAEIQRRILDVNHPALAITLSNLATYYYNAGVMSRAIELAEEAAAARRASIGENHPDYAYSLTLLAECHSRMGNKKEALRYGIASEALRRNTLSERSPLYPATLSNLAKYYTDLGNHDEASTHMSRCMNLLRNIVLSNFSSLTSHERNLFWAQYSDVIVNQLPRTLAYTSISEMSGNLYNGVLMSKGLLLNADREMSNLLKESGDEEVLSIFNKIASSKQTIDSQLRLPINERSTNIDSLIGAVDKLERSLVEKSKIYGDYTRNLSIDWLSVQSKLSKGEAAVEFLSYDEWTGSDRYAALVIKPGMKAPKFIKLCREKDIDSVASPYHSTSLSDLLWKPLAKELKGCKEIFYSPAGRLYGIAVESLRHWDGKGYMNTRFNLHRLSSTRELALTNQRHPLTLNPIIIGGLRYDAAASELSPDIASADRSSRSAFDIGEDTIQNARYGVSNLPGTLQEARRLSAMLESRQCPHILLTDMDGNESAFKSLSRQPIGLLHIGTHGFVVSKDSMWKSRYKWHFDSNGQLSNEDEALLRSGLLLSGANYSLSGNRVPEGMDDGVLTAREIASLDFRGLNIVVMSACQSGLGDVTADGVYGLQRGFKKAGASTLVMSLWKVDDEATALIMERFYERLLAGDDADRSMVEAQRYVREYEAADGSRPYSNPRYWASFIVLDGSGR